GGRRCPRAPGTHAHKAAWTAFPSFGLRRVAPHGPWKERPKETTLGSGDRGDRLMPAASSEAALLSASDRSGFERALYGFAGALQGLRARLGRRVRLLWHCSRCA